MDVLTDPSESAWRDFLDEYPGSTIFQSIELSKVYARCRGYRPIVIAIESTGEIKALMAGALISYVEGVLAPLATHGVIIGGPIGNPEFYPALLSAYQDSYGRRALLTQIRNLNTPTDLSDFTSAGYRWEDHLNYLIDLTQGEDSVLCGMTRERRREVQRGDQGGLELRKVKSSELDLAYALLRKSYQRARMPLADRTLFENAMDVLTPRGLLLAYGAWLGRNLCAVRFVLAWRRTLYDWYAGSSDLGREAHANAWLVWRILREGMDSGSEVFDFGGAGPPNAPYGPGEFKRRFGGRQINPGRFERVEHPLLHRISLAAFDITRRLT